MRAIRLLIYEASIISSVHTCTDGAIPFDLYFNTYELAMHAEMMEERERERSRASH